MCVCVCLLGVWEQHLISVDLPPNEPLYLCGQAICLPSAWCSVLREGEEGRERRKKKTGERRSDGKGVMETRWKDEFRWDLDEREDRGQVFGAPCYHKGEGGVKCLSTRRMI